MTTELEKYKNAVIDLQQMLISSCETNRRLNRRLQRFQSKVAKYRWRYLSLKNQVEEHKKWLYNERLQVRSFYREMRKDFYILYPYWIVKNKIRSLSTRIWLWWRFKNERT